MVFITELFMEEVGTAVDLLGEVEVLLVEEVLEVLEVVLLVEAVRQGVGRV